MIALSVVFQLQNNLTEEMPHEMTDLVTWSVPEVPDTGRLAIRQYAESEMAKRDGRNEEGSDAELRTAGVLPGHGKRRSSGQPSPLRSQRSPGLSPARSRPLPPGGELRAANIAEAEPAGAPPHPAGNISGLRGEGTRVGALREHPRQEFPRRQTYIPYKSAGKGGAGPHRLAREDVSPCLEQDRPTGGTQRNFFSQIGVWGRTLRAEEHVQRDGQLPGPLQVPGLVQPPSGGIGKPSPCRGAPELEPSASRPDTLSEPRAVCSGGAVPWMGRQLARKLCFSSRQKVFPNEEAPGSEPLPTYALAPRPSQSLTRIYAEAFSEASGARLTSEPVPARKLLARGNAVPGSDPSRIGADVVKSVLTQLSACLATDPQPSEDQGLPPDVAVLAAQIIHSSLSELLHDGASKVTVYPDPSGKESAPAEGSDVWLWGEMANDRREGAVAKAPSSALSTPREPGEFGERQLEDASKSTARRQSPPPPTLEVGPGCLEDAIGRLLSRALPATASTSASTEKKAAPADVDLTHVKVIGRVLARICRGETSSCQCVVPPPGREESASQTIADAVYGRLLMRFLSKLDMRQRVRSGSTVLGEALWDSVVREISGKPLQNSLGGELVRRLVETAPRAVIEPLGDSSRCSPDLHATVALIAEKLAASLLSAFPCLVPVAALDAEKALLANEEARKIRHALRALLSSHRRNGDEQIGGRAFVRAEDGQATGDLSPSARASPADRADSDLCSCRGLTGREAVFAPGITASGAQHVASPGA